MSLPATRPERAASAFPVRRDATTSVAVGFAEVRRTRTGEALASRAHTFQPGTPSLLGAARNGRSRATRRAERGARCEPYRTHQPAERNYCWLSKPHLRRSVNYRPAKQRPRRAVLKALAVGKASDQRIDIHSAFTERPLAGVTATPRRHLAGLCAIRWEPPWLPRQGTTGGCPTGTARAVPSA